MFWLFFNQLSILFSLPGKKCTTEGQTVSKSEISFVAKNSHTMHEFLSLNKLDQYPAFFGQLRWMSREQGPFGLPCWLGVIIGRSLSDPRISALLAKCYVDAMESSGKAFEDFLAMASPAVQLLLRRPRRGDAIVAKSADPRNESELIGGIKAAGAQISASSISSGIIQSHFPSLFLHVNIVQWKQ